jgi:FtsZ-binding cell division protein ZapB
MFGGLLGVLISNIFDNTLIKHLEKKLDKAIDDMFEKDLELDELEEKIGMLNDELNNFKAKFPDVELTADSEGYVSDSSTEQGNTD